MVLTQSDKKVLQKLEGDQIGLVFDSLAKLSEEHKVQFEKNVSIWHPKVKQLLEDSPIILLAKGPQNTEEESTKKIVEILTNNQLQYSYHNVLADEQLGHWIAHYTKSQIYPALFIEGKFVGGVDQIQRYVEKG